MPKLPHPPPPERLAEVGAEQRVVAAGTALFRVYFLDGPHPTIWNEFRFYGPAAGRFDPHAPPPRLQDRGVMYLAAHPRTCLAEVFQTKRRIDVSTGQPMLVGFRLAADVWLLDLTGLWPTRAGASMAINSGPRPTARRWARAIYEAFPALDGLFYASSMAGNAPCLALFERAARAVAIAPELHRPVADPLLRAFLRRTAIALGYGL
jgi:RES domain